MLFLVFEYDVAVLYGPHVDGTVVGGRGHVSAVGGGSYAHHGILQAVRDIESRVLGKITFLALPNPTLTQISIVWIMDSLR